MNDLWSWMTLGGAVGIGTAAREIAGLVARLFGYQAQARRTAAEIEAKLREGLWREIERLGSEVADLRVRAEECEAHARECRDENERLREHADGLSVRIGQLEARG